MLYKVGRRDEWGYIDGKGNIIVDINAKYLQEFHDGFGVVGRDWGLEIVDEKGRITGSCRGVTSVDPFSEGRLPVVDNAKRVEDTDHAAGYLDQKGQWVIPPKFRDGNGFHEGVAAARINLGDVNTTEYAEALIDLDGNWLFAPKFERIWPFGPKMTVTVAKQHFVENGEGNYRLLLIDKSGRRVGKDYYQIARVGNEGLLPVAGEDGRFGCVDESGQVAIPFKFESITTFSEGVATASNEEGKFGAIDKNGHWEIHPVFLDVGRFCGGIAYAVIKEEGICKWGFIDRNGDWAIKPKFEDADDFQEGIARVVPLFGDLDDVEHIGYINLQGEYIWEPSIVGEK